MRWGLPALPVLAALLLGSCADAPKPAEEKPPAADTTKRLSQNLPPGRFQLPTRHTPVPDFYITLPQGYTVKNLSQLPNDEYFFVRSDDPSLTDRKATTPGFMRFYVGVRAQSALDPARKHTEENVLVGRTPLTWTIWTEKLDDGAPYYVREITSDDYFANLSPEFANAPLHLHIYVAGRDSGRVAELAAAAATLSMTP